MDDRHQPQRREGKQTRKIMRYSGGYPAYREHCDAVAAMGYSKLALG